MAKVYDDNGAKLSTVEVITLINANLNEHTAKIMYASIPFTVSGIDAGCADNYPAFMVAAVIMDSYRYLPSVTKDDEKFKKWCLFVQNKFMKSKVGSADELDACRTLLSNIKTLAVPV